MFVGDKYSGTNKIKYKNDISQNVNNLINKEFDYEAKDGYSKSLLKYESKPLNLD